MIQHPWREFEVFCDVHGDVLIEPFQLARREDDQYEWVVHNEHPNIRRIEPGEFPDHDDEVTDDAVEAARLRHALEPEVQKPGETARPQAVFTAIVSRWLVELDCPHLHDRERGEPRSFHHERRHTEFGTDLGRFAKHGSYRASLQRLAQIPRAFPTQSGN